MTKFGREDDIGSMGDGAILSRERGEDRAEFRGIGFEFGELRGLGVRSVSAETVGSSGGFRRSGMVFRCGSLGDMSVCPFNVLPPAGVASLGGAGSFGGGGNGGGNFPRRLPLSMLSVAPPRPVVNPSPVSTRTRSVELDLTSERYSISSPEKVNELRGEEDDKRGRENR